MASNTSKYFKSIGTSIRNGVADVLSSSDFISRTIGMTDSYEGLMYIVQSLGREPISLLGKDYPYIYDHVRRNYLNGTQVSSYMFGSGEYGCTKFTFYKEKPTIKFADPYFDPQNFLERWMPDFKLSDTKRSVTGIYYAESNDDEVNNKSIDVSDANTGVANGQQAKSFDGLVSCDLVKKTNDNFNAGRYRTLIARFHTNSEDSKSIENPTQTAISKTYGMSHGRNLLKYDHEGRVTNGYSNPYCRVWTYHHEYNQMNRAIRPFGVAHTAEELEKYELGDDYGLGGFRTIESKDYGFKSGSERLDNHGVLNYENGFVNIAPTAKIKDYFEHKEDDKDRKSVSTKRCMFSIENLAWRDDKNKMDEFDAYGLSAEQKGPLGGRIMWFPPYDLSFNEDVRVKWNSNEFIGRGENIYTYTNTERTGNLSFTLLIDHPSILDYWTGHERNGMTNGNDKLIPGNGTDGGVDNVKSQEQTLLRFFAGCDILTAKPQEYWMRGKTPQAVGKTPEQKPPKEVNPNPVKTDETPKEGVKTICCVLYYPNNYSGRDDQPFGNNKYVNAIHYLMNGIGAQKTVNDAGNDVEDIPTILNARPKVNGTEYGGYEVIKGISVIDKPISGKTAQQASYEKDRNAKPVEKVQYITSDNAGTRYTVSNYGEQEYVLAKMVWNSGIKAKAKAEYKTYAQAGQKLWHRMRWYYRVDKKYVDDCLTTPESYIDYPCHQLNGAGYEKGRSTNGSFRISEESDKFHLISFTSLFNALEGETVIKGGTCGVIDSDVKRIQKIMDKDSGIKIKSIHFRGHASSAGNVKDNKDLAKHRAETFKAWMMGKGFPEPESEEAKVIESIIQDPNDHIDNGVANDVLAKIWRSASVMIEYEEFSTESAQKKDTVVETEKGADGKQKPVESEDTIKYIGLDGKVVDTGIKYTLNKVDTVTNLNQSKEVSPGAINSARDWLENTPEGRELLRTGYTATEYIRMPSGAIQEVKVPKMIDRNTITMAEIGKILGKDFFDTNAVNYDNSYMQNKEMENVVVGKSTVKRYDNEGEFFELLERNAPFMHHLITDKIKYFDPAYHAISPEGFNARLTFLQQCTRQGPTIGNSDYMSKTAYNLAFGRPPVCVLRLGDFYYTKIIINSINIQYDNAQWDLNPEGIGVMPMFAKVSMSFTFLGGSDLAGPISRLQNAVSFNYYANASVYDNRAERVMYSDNGDGKEILYKPFTYPNPYGERSRNLIIGDGDNSIKKDNIDRSGVGYEDA
jgi:hypothetical protein